MMPDEPPPLVAAPAEVSEHLDLAALPGAAASFAASTVADEETEGPAAAPAQPGLTLEAVASQWEMVKKACKTKTNKLAALLNHAHPVAVVSADGCEVFIQVEFEFHYTKLLEPESRRVMEWALKEIFQLPCRARFLQKGEPIPVSLASSGQPGAARAPQAREPEAGRGAVPLAEPVQPSASAAFPDAPANGAAAPRQAADALAAQNGYGASAPPANALEARVRQDPVVEEIIKTFGAKLVECKPLEDDM